MKVKAILSTARGFANAVNRQAVQDKQFAQELVFRHGLRGDITPKSLQGITKDFYDKSGKLTEQGKQELQRVLKEVGLTENATWDEVLQAIIKSKNEAFERIKNIKLEKVLPKDFDIKSMQENIAHELRKISQDSSKKFTLTRENPNIQSIQEKFAKMLDPKYKNEINKTFQNLDQKLDRIKEHIGLFKRNA